MTKIKVSAVSYLNTKPMLYGIFNHDVYNDIELSLDVPSICAEKFIHDKVDLALMPVGALHQLDQYYLVSDYGIGTDGEVRTVCIYSDVPMEEIETVFLDFDSRTSVLLAQYLLKHFWKKNVNYLPGPEGFEENIKGKSAGLIIGDIALDQELKSPYIYDLGKAWKEMHDLPFVFAVWVSKTKLPERFVEKFNAAQAKGIAHIDQLVQLMANTRKHFDLDEYYNKNISYRLDPDKRKALELFLSLTRKNIDTTLIS
jgi:chorismate dehydratase